MLLNIILSDFQQYRTLLAKVIQFFVSPNKCKKQRYKFLTPDRRYGPNCKKTSTLLHANNKGAHQPAHLRSLFTTFVILSLQSTLWSYHYCNLGFVTYSGVKVTFSSCSISSFTLITDKRPKMLRFRLGFVHQIYIVSFSFKII